MSSTTAAATDTAVTLRALGELREHFDAYFDTGWFSILIEGSPIQFTAIREIRAALSRDRLYPEDIASLRYGVSLLRQFAARLRRYLLPALRERLGISGLVAHRPVLSAEEYVYRQLVAATFPANVKRLEELTEKLAAVLARADSAY